MDESNKENVGEVIDLDIDFNNKENDNEKQQLKSTILCNVVSVWTSCKKARLFVDDLAYMNSTLIASFLTYYLRHIARVLFVDILYNLVLFSSYPSSNGSLKLTLLSRLYA